MLLDGSVVRGRAVTTSVYDSDRPSLVVRRTEAVRHVGVDGTVVDADHHEGTGGVDDGAGRRGQHHDTVDHRHRLLHGGRQRHLPRLWWQAGLERAGVP
jgi:hypothetical protein